MEQTIFHEDKTWRPASAPGADVLALPKEQSFVPCVRTSQGLPYVVTLGNDFTRSTPPLYSDEIWGHWVETSCDLRQVRIFDGAREYKCSTMDIVRALKKYRSVLTSNYWLQVTLPQLPNWLVNLEDLDEAEVTQENLSEIMRELNKLFANRNFETVSEILNAVDPKRYSIKVLLALSRGTFKAKSAIENWRKIVESFKSEATTRNMNAGSLFKGL
ncbi:hypothetical protein [Hyphomonas adhaerens]|uniref:hypothetical protein n=1 Tax=Hyphomonas adhaerens TaxID=81029 RepID=UPI0023567A88|nr:hypothetical protein [Hyphomonas adhaerens]